MASSSSSSSSSSSHLIHHHRQQHQDVAIGEDDFDDDPHHHPHLHNLSRLSLCASSSTHDSSSINEDNGYYHYQDHEQGGCGSMSLLSIESFDADEELEAGKELLRGVGIMSSDSEKEAGSYSLPGTPPRWRRKIKGQPIIDDHEVINKEYASENELLAQEGTRRTRRRRRPITKERWPDRSSDWPPLLPDNSNNTPDQYKKTSSPTGESETGNGVLVITRPKGGRRSLCMDLEEVKACNDLGFELEHERMLEIMPYSRTLDIDIDTSSGGNSPIASWRISSPGDDPRDVKARLKVWAQAVALASTSGKGLDF